MSQPAQFLPSDEGIRGYLPTALTRLPVFVYPILDSTNTQGRRMLAEGLLTPFVVVAHSQTAGKGRLGRSFYSPPNSGLYMTLVYTASGASGQAARATSAAAVAVCDAISEVCGKEAGIKWVNDLYLDGKKVCGILAEAIPCAEGCHVILGIGVNLTTKDFPDGMRHPAGAVLSGEDAPVELSRLCAAITEKLFDCLSPEAAERCLVAYRRRLLLVGQRVLCSRNFAPDGSPDPTVSLEGLVEGVDDDYGLILRLKDGTRQVLRGGEISLWIKSF